MSRLQHCWWKLFKIVLGFTPRRRPWKLCNRQLHNFQRPHYYLFFAWQPTPITWKSLTDAVNGGNSRGNADHPLHWTQRPSKVHYTFYRWPTPHLWCIRLWGSRRLSPAQTTGREFLVQIIAKLRLLSRREESHIETLPLANPDVKDAAIIG